jgi:hypothetical protein
MEATTSLTGWLNHLRSLAPIQGLVLVGAGSGALASRFKEWGVSKLVLVDADEASTGRLSALAASEPGWSVHAALVSEVEQETDYFLASNPNENGLIPPDRLTGFWKNLQVRGQLKLPAITLDKLLADRADHTALNWAFVGCLPAVPVLKGAPQLLASCDVVAARVVLDEDRLPGVGATRTELDAFLSAQAFRCVAFEQERHPGMGMALYLRDWKYELQRHRADTQAVSARHQQEIDNLSGGRNALALQAQKLARSLDEQISKAEYIKLELDQANGASKALATTRDEHTTLIAHLQQELQESAQSREQAAALALQLRQDVEKWTESNNFYTQLATQRQHQLEDLTKAGHEQTVVIARLQEELKESTQARELDAQAAAQLQQELGKHRDEHAALVARLQQDVQQWTQAHDGEAESAAQLREEVNKWTLSNNHHADLAAQRQQQIEELTRSREEQAALITRLQDDVRNWTQAGGQSTETIAQLRQEIEKWTQSNNHYVQLAAQRQQQLEALTHTHDEQMVLLAGLEQDIQKWTQSSNHYSQLAAQRQQEAEKLARAGDEQLALITRLQQDVANWTKARDHEAQTAAQLREEIQKWTVSRDQFAELAQQRQRELDQQSDKTAMLKADLDRLTKAEESLGQDLREARQTAALSVRLQSLREADLKDLQQRYQASVEVQEKQHQLLGKLSERLNTAAVYFHQLSVAKSEAKPLPAAKKALPVAKKTLTAAKTLPSAKKTLPVATKPDPRKPAVRPAAVTKPAKKRRAS